MIVRVSIGRVHVLIGRPSHLRALRERRDPKDTATDHARCDAATLIQVAGLNLINRRRIERAMRTHTDVRRAFVAWKAVYPPRTRV